MKGWKSRFLPNLSHRYAAPPYEIIGDKKKEIIAIIL